MSFHSVTYSGRAKTPALPSRLTVTKGFSKNQFRSKYYANLYINDSAYCNGTGKESQRGQW